MPRSASKSQADKGGGRSSVQLSPPPVQEPEGDDSAAVCVAQSPWMDGVAQEDSEATVGEIMEELMNNVMESCHQTDIERQVVPFSALWAKGYIMQVLEGQFICLDEPEELEEATRTEDAEPVPAASDSWARGCVPVLKSEHQHDPVLHKEAMVDKAPTKKDQTLYQQTDVSTQRNILQKRAEQNQRTKGPASDQQRHVRTYVAPTKEERKNKNPIACSPVSTSATRLPPLSCSPEDTGHESNTVSSSSGLVGRPSPRSKNIVTFPRLQVSHLPHHCVFPQYEIVENCNANKSDSVRGVLSRTSKYSTQQSGGLVSSTRLSDAAKREGSKK